MQAIVLEKQGSEVKVLNDFKVPEPNDCEVRIKVHSCALNPVDYKLAKQGHHNFTYPHILGVDVSGVVDKIGGNKTQTEQGLKVGDKCIALLDVRRGGGLAGYAIARTEVVSRLPKNCSFEQAATLPMSGFTAYLALFKKLHINKHHRDSILITGVRGGVGSFAIRLAAANCTTVIASCAPEFAELAKSLGATHVIDPTKESVKGRTLEIVKGGVNAVLDLVSGDSATKVAGALAFDGSMACVAKIADTRAKEFPHYKQISLHEINIAGSFDSPTTLKYLGKLGSDLATLVEASSKIVPHLSVIQPNEVGVALKQLEEKKVTGKIVVKFA